MMQTFIRLTASLIILALCGSIAAAADGFKQYSDPRLRFFFDYPATMNVTSKGADEVKISHPGATLRITVFVEKRPRRAVPDAKGLLEAFKSKLKEEMKDVSILEEGKLKGLEGSQGYLICSFKDARGIRLVQLIQYYVSEESVLQLIISDRPEGFKNLADVIRRIHGSLKVASPSLK
jgi:hypothetical protein